MPVVRQYLVNKEAFLEKFPGKGGWTYVRFAEIPKNPDTYFGMYRIKGSIDDYEIKRAHLMPMGNGQLFLPVNAAIRKKIRKEAGDRVHVVLYQDE